MAMPKSAWASAGASLIPSPTMATLQRAGFLKLANDSRFVCRTDLGTDVVNPHLPRDAWAAARLSPVSKIVRSPIRCNFATAAAESSLI